MRCNFFIDVNRTKEGARSRKADSLINQISHFSKACGRKMHGFELPVGCHHSALVLTQQKVNKSGRSNISICGGILYEGRKSLPLSLRSPYLYFMNMWSLIMSPVCSFTPFHLAANQATSVFLHSDCTTLRTCEEKLLKCSPIGGVLKYTSLG